ncbi:interferon regulatory factor 7 isoform X2 [Micropterus dolomieu]|uniref:interferon regulatory factor 7 isoform X1 n=1 Tax=Micropterus dolomieu TaxID=147949 RepID=UPI001E8D156B|nr:interferon regulatory factor 7 isoform X1 [Micropterus dolomieu]XP_045894463.1 interferon regulatory factor 7 isoform X2 [Micropterus dolomieu]
MQSPPKPQFASWLIEQVETGQYTGLCYVGQNKFRVPWKHNSRKDCNDMDSKIFRAWAVASGKIHEFPTDKARWKTNFRCALNNLEKRFKMIEDNSKNSDDPHKVYEIINTENIYERLPTQDSQEDSDIALDIYSSPTEFPSGNEHNLINDFMALDLVNLPSEEQPWAEKPYSAVVESYHVAPENHPLLLPDQPSYYVANPEPVLNSPLQPTIYDLEISIHYRKREMLKGTFHTARLQLHYLHEAPELNTNHLCFPSTDDLLDHKQIEFTNRILNSIQRGLLLEVRDTGIYALRQDRCHVFASTSDPSVAHPDPRKLPQNTMVELLSFEKYVNELKQFKDNNGRSPEYTINMCFGEKFPDGKPLEKKLIVVKVVPLICRHFHEMAQMEGASSLHSANVSLQISHNSLYDLIYSVFGLPTTEETARAAEPFLHQI